MSTTGDDGRPPETRFIESGDARLEVSLAGGPGGGALLVGAAHPADAFGVETAALLRQAAGAGVVCVNPRGLGGSSPAAPGRPHPLEDMVDDVEAARRRVGQGPWVFWGMSGGGWLGLIYARKYPEALAGLILDSTCFRDRLGDASCVLSPFHPAWRAALAERRLIAADSHQEVGDPDATEWIDVPAVGSVFRRATAPRCWCRRCPSASR